MLRFLFWNLNRKRLAAAIGHIVRSREVDVVLLAENVIPPGEVVWALNSTGTADYTYAPGQCERIDVFSRLSGRMLVPVHESRHWSIRHLRLPGRTSIVVAAIHGISKAHWKDDSQAHECIRFADDLRRSEQEVGHGNSLVIGDLNMNPFESAMVSAVGLNASMSRAIAHRGARTVQGRSYHFFYNPMWGHFGDLAASPPGTYYREESEHVGYFWHMFDQVLLRPTLLQYFEHENLEIVSQIAPGGVQTSLLSSRGVPDASIGSDHLPIVLGLTV